MFYDETSVLKMYQITLLKVQFQTLAQHLLPSSVQVPIGINVWRRIFANFTRPKKTDV